MPGSGVIYVVGMGPGDPLDLPSLNLSLLLSYRVYLRTERHPVVPCLREYGAELHSLDCFYKKGSSIEGVYRQVAEFLLERALEQRDPVVFAVPGNPLVDEAVVHTLRRSAPAKGVAVRIFTAPGFFDILYPLLGIEPGSDLVIADGFLFCADQNRCSPAFLPEEAGLLIMQLDSCVPASEVKSALRERFPDEYPVTVVQNVGVRGAERVFTIPLYELDRSDLEHLTAIYLPPLADQEQVAVPGNGDAGGHCSLEPLVEVMDSLLSPTGCPWDRQQTHRSLKKYLIEESYEVIDAIDEGDMHKLCEELGDLLLQVVFHSALAEQEGGFTLTEVIDGITAKMIRRHPHVFGETRVRDTADVLKNWESIKQDQEGEWKSLLAGVPRHLPSLQRAQKVQGKAALVGFDWPDPYGAAAKVEEEWQEVKDAWAEGNRDELCQEFGDLLFAIANTCRLLRIDAEDVLRGAVDKFMKRFRFMELRAHQDGIKLDALTLDELDSLWDEAKECERQKQKNNK